MRAFNGVLGRCPTGWIQQHKSDSHCYLFYEGKKTWAAAKTYCQQKNANLVSIHSKEENDFIAKNMLKSGHYWMGFNDIVKVNKWVWSDMSPATYTNWYKGEPNGGNSENCGELNRFGAAWNDFGCSNKLYFICKRKALPKWFNLPAIKLGNLPNVPNTNVLYTIPAKVPRSARKILLFVTTHSKFNPGHNTKGKFEIFTKDNGYKFSKYMGVFLYSGMHTTSNSQNIWLPSPTDRLVRVRYFGPAARHHLSGSLYVVGYMYKH